MNKVTCEAYPADRREVRKDIFTSPARVEVVARGEIFTEEILYKRGTAGSEVSWTEKEVIEKFKNNASQCLTQEKTDRAIETILELDKIDNITRLIQEITL